MSQPPHNRHHSETLPKKTITTKNRPPAARLKEEEANTIYTAARRRRIRNQTETFEVSGNVATRDWSVEQPVCTVICSRSDAVLNATRNCLQQEAAKRRRRCVWAALKKAALQGAGPVGQRSCILPLEQASCKFWRQN